MHAPCLPCTAIIHLREPARPLVRRAIRRMIKILKGVQRVEYEPKAATLAVRFDREKAGLAEIVRIIEDNGTAVSSVAQRA